MRTLWQALNTDATSAWRRLIRRPGFTLISSLTLGLALGANVLVFAMYYGLALRPLPYLAGNQLIVIREQMVKQGIVGASVSSALYRRLKAAPGIDDSGLSTTDPTRVGIRGIQQVKMVEYLTPSVFQVLGVRPLLGTDLSESSGHPGGPKEVVISYAVWKQLFHGAADVLRQTLQIKGKEYQIVGVMPRHFYFPYGKVDYWVPLVITPRLANDHNVNYRMFVRKQSGWTLARLNTTLRTLRDREIQSAAPARQKQLRNGGYQIDARPWRETILSAIGGLAPFLWLGGMTLLLLVLAILNNINLGLARQRRRFGELALRQVLGAGRITILRTVLWEYLPVFIGICLTAGLAAWYAIRIMHAYQLPSPYMPTFIISVSWSVLSYLLLAGFLVTVAISLVPALLAIARPQNTDITRELATQSSMSRPLRYTQRFLGTTQIAIAVALIICGTLLIHSLLNLLNRPLHFDPRHVAVAALVLPHKAKLGPLWNTLEPALQATPGFSHVALTTMAPFYHKYIAAYPIYRNVKKSISKNQLAWRIYTTADLFGVLHIKPLFGRLFTKADETGDSTAAILSAAAAYSLFGRLNVVGETVNKKLHVIGVVPSIPWQYPKVISLNHRAVYRPLEVRSGEFVLVTVKSSLDMPATLATLRRVLAKTVPDAATWQVRSLSDLMRRTYLYDSVFTSLMMVFGGLSFLIAVFGVYAIVAYNTRLRLFEFGIRQVLGATRSSILGLTLKETATLFVIGGALGIAAAYALAHVLRSLLYGVGVLDAAAYLGSLAVIAAAVFTASAWPAWWAARRDPAQIMREQT